MNLTLRKPNRRITSSKTRARLREFVDRRGGSNDGSPRVRAGLITVRCSAPTSAAMMLGEVERRGRIEGRVIVDHGEHAGNC